MSTRVLIVHNEPVLPDCDPESEAERAVAATVAAVREHLGNAGFEVECLAIGRDLQAFRAYVARWPPDVIFNLFEGLGDDPTSESRAARALESLAIPLTGCPSWVLRLAGSKHLAKAALAAAGLPTLKAAVIAAVPFEQCGLNWPVIAKPALYHGSVGIEQASVATKASQLAGRVEYLLGRYRGPVLVEEFVVGREFTATVVETPQRVALPAMEFEFVDAGSAYWPLVTYDAKWRPDSREYRSTPVRHGVQLTPTLKQHLNDLACRAFRKLGCRDYARVDFRLDARGKPWILEVNPNPDLSPSACLAGALTAAGLDYAEFVVSLARAALSRARTTGLTPAVAVR